MSCNGDNETSAEPGEIFQENELERRVQTHLRSVAQNMQTILTAEQRKKYCLLLGAKVVGEFENQEEMEREYARIGQHLLLTRYFPVLESD